MVRLQHIRFNLTLATIGLAFSTSASCASGRPTTLASISAAALFARSRCMGIADDRAVADILSGKSVEGVTPLYLNTNNRTNVTVLQGAAIHVRPVPGETAEWLARTLECHAAHITATEAPALALAGDPFVLSESIPTVAVRSAGDGFRVEITSRSTDEARDILGRAQALGGTTDVLALQHER